MQRGIRFLLWIIGTFFFFYILLSFITQKTPVLYRMSEVLEWHEIDPSRWYYSNVPQTLEGEQYLRGVLSTGDDSKEKR